MIEGLVSNQELFDQTAELFREIGMTISVSRLLDDQDRLIGYRYSLMNENKFVVARATVDTNRKRIPARLEYLALTGLIRAMKARHRPFNFYDMLEISGGGKLSFDEALEDYIEYKKTQGYTIHRVTYRKRKEYEEIYNLLYFKPLKKLDKKFTLLGKSSLQIIRELRGKE